MIGSIVKNDVAETETEELKQKADKVEKLEDAADVIKTYEDFIRTKKKSITSIVFHQEKVFKRFKDTENFIKLVKEFKEPKSTIFLN